MSDRTAPLKLRACAHGVVIAQKEFTSSQSVVVAGEPEDERAHAFCLEFSTPLDQGKLFHLSIEVARIDSDSWYTLPRYFKIWGSQPEVSELPKEDWMSGPEHRGEDGSKVAFWSDDAGNVAFDSTESRPVFVLGAVRSGTTALCLALEKGTRYRGFPEGHLLDIAIRLVNAVSAHFERKELWISSEERAAYHLGHVAYSRLQDEAIKVLRSMVSGYTTPFWFDKTPTYQMIASVPVLAQAWPNSRFIFMKRRGLENLRSRIRKFSRMNFPDACKDWALIMSGWRSVRDTIPGRFIEIDQHDLAEYPNRTAAAVGQLLGLESDEVAAFEGVLQREHPETTGSKSSFVSDMSELGWSTQQCETFRECCHKEMEAYGYTYDMRYVR